MACIEQVDASVAFHRTLLTEAAEPPAQVPAEQQHEPPKQSEETHVEVKEEPKEVKTQEGGPLVDTRPKIKDRSTSSRRPNPMRCRTFADVLDVASQDLESNSTYASLSLQDQCLFRLISLRAPIRDFLRSTAIEAGVLSNAGLFIYHSVALGICLTDCFLCICMYIYIYRERERQ